MIFEIDRTPEGRYALPTETIVAILSRPDLYDSVDITEAIEAIVAERLEAEQARIAVLEGRVRTLLDIGHRWRGKHRYTVWFLNTFYPQNRPEEAQEGTQDGRTASEGTLGGSDGQEAADGLLAEIAAERAKVAVKHKDAWFRSQMYTNRRMGFIESFETDPTGHRADLIRLAALAQAWVEAIGSRQAPKSEPQPHLTGTQLAVLAALADVPSAGAARIAQVTHVGLSTAATTLRSLRDAGLVCNPRPVAYVITDAGRTYLTTMNGA